MLDFRITTFIAVCKYMNYTKAANELCITQPAVSQHIKYLEEEYKTKLFIANGRKMSLTESGKILYRTMTAMNNDETILKERLSEKDGLSFPVHFGVTKTIGDYVMIDAMKKFMRENPNVNIKMIMLNTKELLQELSEGNIQFALVEGYYPTDDCDSLLLRTEEFIAVCGKDYVLKKEPEAITDLLEERLLLREEGSGTRSILEKNLQAKNMSIENFKNSAEFGSIRLIVELLKENLGISFIYKAAVEKELEEGILREIKIPNFEIKHDFTFIWEKESTFSDKYKEICTEILTKIQE